MLPETMTVIEAKGSRGPELLVPATRPLPEPGPGELLIEVAAAGINRPDVLQRMGLTRRRKAPPTFPAWKSPARSSRLGSGVSRFKLGR